MEKGTLGIRVAFYGVAGFAAVLFGNYIVLALLLGVALIVEKNEWATRQILQAACLLMAGTLLSTVLNLLNVFDWISWITDDYYGSFFYKANYRIPTILSFALGVAVDVFAILGILKNVKGQDAKIPVASKFADWVYGVVTVKPQPAPVQYAAPAQPVAPAQPAPAANNCTNCGAPLNGAAFCTKCGTPAAK